MHKAGVYSRNCITYRIFCRDVDNDTSCETFLRNIREFALSLTNLHIWQRQAFNLSKDQDKASSSKCFSFKGQVEFGDCIDDEWLTVWLLRCISVQFPNVVIECVDDDGQFLLIECAETLPDWLNPDTSLNRVFLHNGALHIIPLTLVADKIRSRHKAMEIILDNETTTKASADINAALGARLSAYPECAFRASSHYSRCVLPRKAAAILQQNPHLITAAIEAFYHRDPIDMRFCREMREFGADFDDVVVSRIRFTRCSYAQMVSQRFQEPAVFSSFPLPPEPSPSPSSSPSSSLSPSPSPSLSASPDPWRKLARRNGIRVMCGMEILFRSARTNTAKRHNDPEGGVESPKRLIRTFDEVDALKFVRNVGDGDGDDSVSWMEIEPQRIDEMAQRYHVGEAFDLEEDIVTKVKKFMSGSSGFEGVFGDGDGDGDGDSSDEERDHKAFEMDVQSFLAALKGEVELESQDDSDDEFAKAHLLSRGDTHDGDGDGKRSLNAYMERFDEELLSRERIQHGFERDEGDGDGDGDGDGLAPIDVDLNLLKNILEAHASSHGEAGPADNLLQSLGIMLPDNAEA